MARYAFLLQYLGRGLRLRHARGGYARKIEQPSGIPTVFHWLKPDPIKSLLQFAYVKR
jgi:hypothetical protein